MHWNKWQRTSPASESELVRAAKEAGAPARLDAAGRISWQLRKADVDAFADDHADELDDDWRHELDDIDRLSYEIVVEIEVLEGATILTWDPKSGDNHAAWPIAFVMARRFAEKLGAEPLQITAADLVAPEPSIGAHVPALRVIPLRGSCVLPSGRLTPMSFGRASSIEALQRTSEAGPAHCIFAVQTDPEVEHPGLDDLEDIGCVVRIAKLVTVSPNDVIAIVAGSDRVQLRPLDTAGSELVATGTRIQPAAPDHRLRPLLLEAAETLAEYVIPQDEIADDAIEILSQLAPELLADAACEIYAPLLAVETRLAVLQATDPSDRLMTVIEALSELGSGFADATAEHRGNVQTARGALMDREVAQLRRAVGAKRF